MRRRGAYAAATLALLTASSGASAEESARFGDGRGRLAVSVDRLLPIASYTRQTISSTQGPSTRRIEDGGGSIALFGREPEPGAVHSVPRLAVDVLLDSRLTVGAAFAFAVGFAGAHVDASSQEGAPTTARETSGDRSLTVGVAPRVGYVVPLGSRLALWPRAGLAFYSASTKSAQGSTDPGSTSTTTDTLLSFDLEAPIVWTPIPHALVLIGPLVNVPVAGSHTTAFSQAGTDKTKTDDLSVFHAGLSLGLGLDWSL